MIFVQLCHDAWIQWDTAFIITLIMIVVVGIVLTFCAWLDCEIRNKEIK